MIWRSSKPWGGSVAAKGFPDIGLQDFAPKLAMADIAAQAGTALVY